MSETIATTFTAADLPEWAQRSFAVRWLALRDHSFRCDVFRADSDRPGAAQYRQMLRRQAEKRREWWQNG